ncbi:MAG: hypothetical protein IJ347_01410 [Faecalibacterium sp.]|nr:hypothetical protein [Faecalibacterium sp.]
MDENKKPIGEDTLNDILASVQSGAQPTPEEYNAQKVDDKFRDFFTNTVAVIPDGALAGGNAEPPEEEKPAKKGLFGWLKGLFRREEEPVDEVSEEVLLPGRPIAEEEPEEPVLQPVEAAQEEPADETMQIDLHMMGARPAPAEASDLTGEIRLEELPDEAAPAPAPEKPRKGAGLIRFGEKSEKKAAPTEVSAAQPEPPAPAAVEPQPEATAAAARALTFEDIDIAAILAEGTSATKKAEVAAAVYALTEEPEPAPAELPAAPVVDEPTGEIRLEMEDEPAPQPVQSAPAEELPAQEVPAPAPLPAEEATGLTGEINLQFSDDEAAEAVAMAATGEISLQPMQPAEKPALSEKANTAAVRLYNEENEEAEQAVPAASAEHPAEEKPAAPAEAEEEVEEPVAAAQEYEEPSDADGVAKTLNTNLARLNLRAALTGVLGAALLVLGLMAQGVLTPISALDPEVAPAAFLGINLVLLAVAMGLSLPILKDGLLGLAGKPSPDSLPAVTALAAALQLAVCLVLGKAYDPAKVTVFAGAAVILLFAATLGHRLTAAIVRDNFDLVSSGVEHSAAYCLKDEKLAARLVEGMDEEKPNLLLNRPAALVKGFMAQSYSARRSDKNAQKLARILLAAAAAAAVIMLLLGNGPIEAVSAFAGVLCLGAPLSATLLAAVPSLLMQRAASRVGAVIPGWYNVAQLGKVDVIQVDAKELFPPACAQLYGIKTFQKERIDYAILYATSILLQGCNTLEGLFREMIQDKTEMLYEVKDLEKKPGLGVVAWCDNCRVVMGNRAMMTLEEIPLPALDYENRYSKDGKRQVLYLAVSGKLYAMFLLGYAGERRVARTLATLRNENIRLLVTCEDPTLTAERIEAAYKLESGYIKVLSAEEQAAMEPAVRYLPASEGCMVHLGSFASLVGGLKAAAGADQAERSACTVQMVSVLFSVLLCVFLSVTGGITGVSLLAALLYQIAWSVLTLAVTLTKKY